jgi:hypothetical protein
MKVQHDHHVKTYWAWRILLMADGVFVRVVMSYD